MACKPTGNPERDRPTGNAVAGWPLSVARPGCTSWRPYGTGRSSTSNAGYYVASLEWIRARENLLLVGPAGTGKSHLLVGTGLRAVEHGLRVRYATAADLVEQLYRGLADNTVGRSIASWLRYDVILIDEVGFAPLDETGTQLLFRLIAGAYERRSIGLASHWPFEDWGKFLPIPSTAAALLDRLFFTSSLGRGRHVR
jgi:DNA replication protein DnaC